MWVGSFVIIVPVIVMNTRNDWAVSEVINTPYSETGSFCMFSSTLLRAKLVNNLCLQLPLLVTIAVNLIFYLRGLHALKDAPQSVSDSRIYYLIMIITMLLHLGCGQRNEAGWSLYVRSTQ